MPSNPAKLRHRNFAVECRAVAGYTPQSMHLELRWRRKPRARRGLVARAGATLLPAALLPVGLLLVGLLLAGLLPPPLSPIAAPAFAQAGYEAAEVQEARDRVLDGRYQTDRPQPEEPRQVEPFTLPPWLAEILYWAILAAVVALVLYFLGNLVLDHLRNRDSFRRNREQPAEGPRRVDTPPLERRRVDAGTLAEADRLAAAGRFAEAIHLLLLVALARLHHELGPRVAPALTGREVLGLPSLPPSTVEPLTRMVRLSELKHFGGREAAEGDYATCRADYLRFNGEPAAA